jgi:thioredoxin-like negative regulator of GroEL
MSGAAVLALIFFFHWQAPADSDRLARRSEDNRQAALTILFFTASWCEPCRAVSPLLEKFACKNKRRVKLLAVDFDRAKAEAARWGVQEIPVVIVLSRQGKVVLRCDGAEQQALRALESGLENLLKSPREKR